VAGKDYPRDLPEFRAWFATEEACVAYVAKVRWRRGFRCPACGGTRAWITAKGLRHCQACGRQVSATAGTIFAGTRKPLQTWFDVMWAVTTDKNGASAVRIAKGSGFGSYQTAWVWLQKLRRAMVRPHQEPLKGVVEVDHRQVGGEEPGAAGWLTVAQATVMTRSKSKGLGRTNQAACG
jgi:hypothetical protein